jgi:hypothetical protein
MLNACAFTASRQMMPVDEIANVQSRCHLVHPHKVLLEGLVGSGIKDRSTQVVAFRKDCHFGCTMSFRLEMFKNLSANESKVVNIKFF